MGNWSLNSILRPVDGSVKDEVANLQGKVSASILGGGCLSLDDQHQVSAEIAALLNHFVHGANSGELPAASVVETPGGPQGSLLWCLADVQQVILTERSGCRGDQREDFRASIDPGFRFSRSLTAPDRAAGINQVSGRGPGGMVGPGGYLSGSSLANSDPVVVMDLPSDGTCTDVGIPKARAVGAMIRCFALHEEDSANRAADSAARELAVGQTRESALTPVCFLTGLFRYLLGHLGTPLDSRVRPDPFPGAGSLA
jgi:hypothetical protein